MALVNARPSDVKDGDLPKAPSGATETRPRSQGDARQGVW